jgi:homoserine dehydrogenase
MKTFNLCLLGFGNVNRSLVELLQRKDADLRDRYGIAWRITGIASRRIGWLANPEGFQPAHLCGAEALTRENLAGAHLLPDLHSWLQAAQPAVLFEATSLNVETGQPAIDYIRAALQFGAHAITANKGPVVHAYPELRDLAARQAKSFLFESTVMDGVPIFSLFARTLPAIDVKAFKGVLNSTTNVILTSMEQGLSFDAALRRAQEIGVAETDASYDIEGWDAAVKVAALVNVIMGERLLPQEVKRQGIGGLTAEVVRASRSDGKPYKLVCRAERTSTGVTASVVPEQLPLSDPMARLAGTSSMIQFETDIFPGLAITEENPGLYATAYGLLADFIRAAGS